MQEALSTLQWFIDAGVDEAIEESPRDYFAAPKAKPEPAASFQQAHATSSVREPAAATRAGRVTKGSAMPVLKPDIP